MAKVHLHVQPKVVGERLAPLPEIHFRRISRLTRSRLRSLLTGHALGQERGRKSTKGWRAGRGERDEQGQRRSREWKRGERWIFTVFPCWPRPPRAVLAAKRHLTISRVRGDGEIQI